MESKVIKWKNWVRKGIVIIKEIVNKDGEIKSLEKGNTNKMERGNKRTEDYKS